MIGQGKAADSTLAVLVFAVETQRCALPADEVREVVRAALPTRLPSAPEIVTGVLNVRGELTPVLDIRQRFGLPPRAMHADDHIIVATTGDRLVGIAVERALDVLSISASQLRQAAEIEPRAQYVRGLARMRDGLLVIWDLHAFLSVEEEHALARALEGAATT